MAYNEIDISSQYTNEYLEKNCTEVILNEGDILYHPAGIWHSVKSEEDSISINFSHNA
jgi:quercetin dioxygenase-like cupin family protein